MNLSSSSLYKHSIQLAQILGTIQTSKLKSGLHSSARRSRCFSQWKIYAYQVLAFLFTILIALHNIKREVEVNSIVTLIMLLTFSSFGVLRFVCIFHLDEILEIINHQLEMEKRSFTSNFNRGKVVELLERHDLQFNINFIILEISRWERLLEVLNITILLTGLLLLITSSIIQIIIYSFGLCNPPLQALQVALGEEGKCSSNNLVIITSFALDTFVFQGFLISTLFVVSTGMASGVIFLLKIINRLDW